MCFEGGLNDVDYFSKDYVFQYSAEYVSKHLGLNERLVESVYRMGDDKAEDNVRHY